MPNWKKVVEGFFKNSDPTGEFFHCAARGIDAKTIANVEKKLKLVLPAELRDFYSHYNGLGLTNGETEPPNFIPSIQDLAEFVNSARKWIVKTHAEIAKRYLPIVDWENGDSSGYMLDDRGDFIDAFFIFEHELYQFDKNQDANEFLSPVANDLHSFLAGR